MGKDQLQDHHSSDKAQTNLLPRTCEQTTLFFYLSFLVCRYCFTELSAFMLISICFNKLCLAPVCKPFTAQTTKGGLLCFKEVKNLLTELHTTFGCRHGELFQMAREVLWEKSFIAICIPVLKPLGFLNARQPASLLQGKRQSVS